MGVKLKLLKNRSVQDYVDVLKESISTLGIYQVPLYVFRTFLCALAYKNTNTVFHIHNLWRLLYSYRVCMKVLVILL